MFFSLITGLLRFSRTIARQVQMGNPQKKAPGFLVSPAVANLALPHEDGRPDIWLFHNAVCSGIYGGTIIDSSNKFYKSFTGFPWGVELHPIGFLPYIGRVSQEVEKAVFLITPEAQGNYYHWVADLLPRLLLVQKKYEKAGIGFKFIVHHPLRKYEVDSLQFLGIRMADVIQLQPFRLARVKELVVTTYENTGTKFPLWKKALFNQVIAEKPQVFVNETPQKIYLVRGAQKKRRLIGEEKLISLLEPLGFKIVNPEKLSFTEQAQCLYNAQLVVALHGAALTNTIFCRPGTKVIELRSEENPPEFFSDIAATNGLHFESIALPPEEKKAQAHRSNKQDLLLTEEAITSLLAYIS